ncbi:STAS domain-containing protein [Polymorphospora rubra]|uniref:STAS domain-containing protein n=1 Tax=Polymorphospora rubra TaxID=338584 RepID=UPI0033F9E272
MDINRHTDDGEVRLALAGELDMSTVDQLNGHVEQVFTHFPPPRRLVVDLAEVTFCDSTGIGALVKALNTATDHHISFRVTNPNGSVRKVLQVTGLLDIMTRESAGDPGRSGG